MLYPFSKTKTNILKSILPFVIILHHLSHKIDDGILAFFDDKDQYVLTIFFAISGYGLVTSYRNRQDYLNGFLKRSLIKLYVPYLLCLFFFTFYRYYYNINVIDVLHEKGICGLVPASWYIFVLSLFYLFFYFVFRYVKTNVLHKILFICILVFIYYYLAKFSGVSYWRYMRCPAFCIGLLFAYYEDEIRVRINKWFAFFTSIVLLWLGSLKMQTLPIFVGGAFFLVVYILPIGKENSVISFFSKISLEMYLVQYIPIMLVLERLQISSTIAIILSVIILDIVLAIATHFLSNRIQLYISSMWHEKI